MPVGDDHGDRLRTLETDLAKLRETTAGLVADVRNQGELVRALAPLVGEMATVRGMAASAIEKAELNAKRIDGIDADERGQRLRRVTNAISITTAAISFVALIIVILQFAGTGGS